jgi:hypothetical protein
MKKSKLLAFGFLLAALGACTAKDVLYCRNQGVEGTSEQGKCMSYYQQQEGLFSADRSVCAADADEVYPPYLYDYGGYAHTTMGTGWGGHHGGGFYGGQSIRIEPDFRRNSEIDRLRMRIIEPCMQAKGWVSGRTWQAGRQAVKPRKQPRTTKPQPVESLPWAR